MLPIKILLVDDEEIFIEDLLNIYNWQENGFEIIATARNGVQALAYTQKLKPQIIITDIRMPIMDGIVFAEELHKLNFSTKLFFLTSYEDFWYAKQAVRYGAVDYILKSEISNDLINEKMQNAKILINQDNNNSILLSQIIIDELFRQQTSNLNIISHEIKERFANKFIYLIIESDNPFPIFTYSESSQKIADILSICQRFQLKNMQSIFSAYLPDSRILMILQASRLSNNIITADLNENAKNLNITLMNNGLNCTIFTISTPQNLAELRNFFFENKKNLNYKYLKGSGAVYSLKFDNIEAIEPYPEFDINLFTRLIEASDISQVNQYVDEYFNGLSESMNYDVLFSTVHAVYTTINNLSNKIGLKLLYNLIELTDIIHFRSWVLESTEKIIKSQSNAQGIEFSPRIRATIKYINENYNNNRLSVEIIAENVKLSSSRLSTKFKKETGVTVNQYITNVRIEWAKNYLKDINFHIYSIADMIGYGSSQYFSRIFFMSEKLTPTQYRDNIFGGKC